MADFMLNNQGSVIGVKPVSDEAHEWWDENVDTAEVFPMGGFIFGDHRPMMRIIEAIDAAGFSTELG